MSLRADIHTAAEYYVARCTSSQKKSGDESFAESSCKEQPAAVIPPKKVKAPVVAKSSVTFKAWPYTETSKIETLYEDVIKNIVIEGLVWGKPSTVIDGPFGLKGIQFGCVIEDELVKTDDIEEALETIGMDDQSAARYKELRRIGELDDHEEEWEGKRVGTVEVISFQKI